MFTTKAPHIRTFPLTRKLCLRSAKCTSDVLDIDMHGHEEVCHADVVSMPVGHQSIVLLPFLAHVNPIVRLRSQAFHRIPESRSFTRAGFDHPVETLGCEFQPSRHLRVIFGHLSIPQPGSGLSFGPCSDVVRRMRMCLHKPVPECPFTIRRNIADVRPLDLKPISS